MAPEAWITAAAEQIWKQLPGTPGYPRALVPLAQGVFHLQVVRLPGLTLELADGWLRRRSLGFLPPAPERALWGCLAVLPDWQGIFLESRAPEEEQGYTLAHEVSHYWIEVRAPRDRARRHLGRGAEAVLDGLRPPTAAERLQAVLYRVPLGPACHLLGRDRVLGVVEGGTLLAEEKADRLALELMAPYEEALRAAPRAGPWAAWVSATAARLGARFGLPGGIAAAYARALAPAAGVAPTFRERLAGVHLGAGR